MTAAGGAHKRFSRKEKQQLTRTAIIEAAITQFAERGLEGSSLESIARHAGLTQGAIYSNFTSKAELWWTVVEQLTHTLDVAGPFESDRPLRHQLEALGASVWRFLRSTSRTELLLAQEFDLFLMRRPRERAKYARAVRGEIDALAATLERSAAARGDALPVPATLLARTIDAVAHGLLHSFMLDPRRVDEQWCVTAFACLAHRPADGAPE
jgi:AcrR family transcriptional regulator